MKCFVQLFSYITQSIELELINFGQDCFVYHIEIENCIQKVSIEN